MRTPPAFATLIPRFGVSVAENLDLCRANEVRHLELHWRPFFDPADLERATALREVFGEVEVSLDSVHGPFGDGVSLAAEDDEERAATVALWRDLIPAVAAAGASLIVAHPHRGRTPRASRTAVGGRLIESLRALVDTLTERGVILALENLGPGRFGSRETDLLPVLEAVDSPAVGLCFDTGHAFLTGRFDALHEALLPRIVHYHLNDTDGLTDRHLPPPYGMIPWGGFWHRYVAHPLARPLVIEAVAPPGWSVAELRREVLALYHSCVEPEGYPRLSEPGSGALMKSVLTGRFKLFERGAEA